VEAPKAEDGSLAVAGGLSRFKELFGDDLVGVNVVAVQHGHDPGMRFEPLHCVLVLVLPAADVDKMTRHGGCCRHGGAHQVGATARTLATFKIAIAGGSAALTGLQPVSIHTQAHGTT